MLRNDDDILEADLKKRVRIVSNKLMRKMKNEPDTIIIESEAGDTDSPDKIVADIRAFLFREVD
jgi:hypothetical protein